jgi:hypothetical protein
LSERSSEIFDSKSPEENTEYEKEKLYAKIGQLKMKCDWLKKNSKRPDCERASIIYL